MPTSYRIVDYELRWPQLFQHEESSVVAALGIDSSRVEHIGSTAVRGLGAKPIIDLMVGIPTVPKLDGGIEQYVEPLQSIGYENRGIETVPGTIYLRKAEPRRYNLHLTKYEGDFWVDNQLFRDYLRSNHDVARRYEELKRELIAALSPDPDPAAYNDGKSSFIKSAIEQAREG